MVRRLRWRDGVIRADGGVSAEQVAVITIVAAVIAALLVIALPERVEEQGAVAVDCLFVADCELGPGDGQATGDGDDGPEGPGGDGPGGDGPGGDGPGGDGPGGDGPGGDGPGGDGPGGGGPGGDGPGDGPGGDGPGGDGPGGDGPGGDGPGGDGPGGDGPGGDGPGGDGPGGGPDEPGEGPGSPPIDDGPTGDEAVDDPVNENLPGGGGVDSSDPTAVDGDPVNTLTGAFVDQTTDLGVVGLGPPVVFGRSYVSNELFEGDLGRGWQHRFEARVVATEDRVLLVGEQGQGSAFVRDGDDLEPVAGVHTQLRATAGGWEARRRDGTGLRFDGDGRLTTVTDRFGRELTVERQNGRISRVTGASGQRLTFRHEGDRIVEIVTADGRNVSYDYDDDGQLIAATDPTGATFRYGYDTDGFLDEVVDANGDVMVASTYEDGRVVAQVEGGDRTWAYAYERDGDQLITTVTDPAGGEHRYRYEARVLTEVVDPAGNETRLRYDADLNLAIVTDARGDTARFRYDGRGRVVAATLPAPFDEPLRFVYEDDGQLAASQDADGSVTRFVYDTDRQLISVTDPTGAVTRLRYDGPAGLPTTQVAPDGGESTVRYDDLGRVVRERSPEGRGADLDYDDAGNLARVRVDTDNGIEEVRFEWDDAGRLVREHDSLGGTTELAYDGVGQLTAVTGPDGATTRYAYDGAYALTAVEAPDGARTRLGWQDGRLVERTAPTGATTRYDYDAAGRIAQVTGPGGQRWRYRHDAVGNLTAIAEPNGLETTIEANALGLPETVATVAGADPRPSVEFDYDVVGQVIAMRDQVGEHTYGYDAVGRLTTRALDGERTHAYAYDAVGDLVERDVQGHGTVRFAYDRDGQPTSIETAEAAVEQRYDGAGRLAEVVHDNGITTSLRYDEASRPSRIRARAADGRTVDAHSYVYGDHGAPVRHVTLSEDTRFDYDDQQRLVRARTIARGTGETVLDETYAYDDAGRRTSVATPDGTTTYRYDDADQLLAVDGPRGETTFAYDRAGNRTRIGDTRVSYGPLGLVEAAESEGIRVDYVTDGSGVRHRAERSDGTTTAYTWDLGVGNAPLLAVTSPQRSERYLTGPAGGVLASLPTAQGADEVSAIHTDALGSVSTLTDTGGQVTDAYGYAPFGLQRNLVGGGDALGLGFTGETRDPTTGLVHLRLRDYDPAVGQFTSLDPAPQSAAAPYVTPYHYGLNAPTLYTDPSGACPFCVTAAIGAVVGGVVGGATQAVSNVINDRPITEGVAGAAASGALTGAVAGVAGPVGGSIARAVGRPATGAASRAATYGINTITGAASADVRTRINEGRAATAGERLLGGAAGAAGTGAGALAQRTGVVTSYQGLNTLRQGAIAAPRNIRNIASDSRNWRALREQTAFSAVWGLSTGAGLALGEQVVRPTSKLP